MNVRILLPRRLVRIVAYVLCTAGTAGLLWLGYSYVDGVIDEQRAERQFTQQLAEKPKNLVPHNLPLKGRDFQDSSAIGNKTAPARPMNSELVGKIEIPRIKLSAMVREGADARTLGRGVGHVPGTALPGDDGNVALAAHRDRHFRGLRNIQLGDEIRVQTTAGIFLYVVDSTRVVPPTEVSVLDPTPEPSITLITCYPFNYIGPAPERFIVRGRRLNTTSEALTIPNELAEERSDGR